MYLLSCSWSLASDTMPTYYMSSSNNLILYDQPSGFTTNKNTTWLSMRQSGGLIAQELTRQTNDFLIQYYRHPWHDMNPQLTRIGLLVRNAHMWRMVHCELALGKSVLESGLLSRYLQDGYPTGTCATLKMMQWYCRLTSCAVWCPDPALSDEHTSWLPQSALWCEHSQSPPIINSEPKNNWQTL